ncbi:MAG: SDR family oxidoreductase [Acidobacteriota bacterium]
MLVTGGSGFIGSHVLRAMAEPGDCAVNFDIRQPQSALRVRLGGTIHVLEVMRIFGLRRLVYFFTIGTLTACEYELIDARHPVMTATDGPGVGFYAASKAASEVFCWSCRQSFGTDFITIRPSAVYGVDQQVSNFIKPMVENAVRGVPSHFATGGPLPRDYTHILDITQLTLGALDIPAAEVRDRIF